MIRAIARVALFVAIVAVVGSAPAHGATVPTFGARLMPVPLVFEEQPWVRVENLAAVPVQVILSASDPAWTLATYGPFVLEPESARKVPVLTAGESEAVIRAELRAITDEQAGPDAVALILETTARHPSILEQLGDSPIPWLLAALVAFLVGAYAIRRRHAYR